MSARRQAWLGALVFLVVLLVAPRAVASVAQLPIRFSVPGIVAGEAPSPKHAKGTLFVFFVGSLDESPNAPPEAEVMEWDIALGRASQTRRLGQVAPGVTLARAVRVSDTIFVVFGSDGGNDEPVTLMRVSTALAVEAREEVGRGTTPSIDTDAMSVVVAFFEDRPATAGPTGRSIVLAPPTKVLHAQVRDAATLGLTSAKVFRGVDGALLSPHATPGRAARAVALYAGHAYLALPLRGETRIVTTRLPQLTVESASHRPWKDEPFASRVLLRVDGGVVAVDETVMAVAGRPTALPSSITRSIGGATDAVFAWGALHCVTRDENGDMGLETNELPRGFRAPR